jgi:hypothetical protein
LKRMLVDGEVTKGWKNSCREGVVLKRFNRTLVDGELTKEEGPNSLRE